VSSTPRLDSVLFAPDKPGEPSDANMLLVEVCVLARQLECELSELKAEHLKLHQSLAKAQLAAVPLCIGRPIIDILAKEGQWISETGQGVVAADDLFRNSPYDALDEANADRLRLREALEKAQQLQYEICGASMAMAHGEPERNVWAAINSMGPTMSIVSEALKTPPPPVVARDDAEALRIDLSAIRMICEAEGMTVTIGDKSLENYRNKYSTPCN